MEDPFEIRLATFDDVRSLNNLISNCGGTTLMKIIFGQFSFPTILESSVLPLVVQSSIDKDLLYGFLALNDVGNLAGDFETEELFGIIQTKFTDAKFLNSLFLNFFALDERIKNGKEIFNNLMKSVFLRESSIEYLFWLFPQTAIMPELVSKCFEEVELLSSFTSNQLSNYRFLVLKKTSMFPRLHVREARVEDNDDIVPIIRSQHPEALISGNDDYFLADLLEKEKDDNNKFYVGVENGRAKGLLSLSLQVNVPLVRNLFDLRSFPGLFDSKLEESVPVILIKSSTKLRDSIIKACIASNFLFMDIQQFTNNNSSNNNSNSSNNNINNQNKDVIFSDHIVEDNIQLFITTKVDQLKIDRSSFGIIILCFESNFDIIRNTTRYRYESLFDHVIDVKPLHTNNNNNNNSTNDNNQEDEEGEDLEEGQEELLSGTFMFNIISHEIYFNGDENSLIDQLNIKLSEILQVNHFKYQELSHSSSINTNAFGITSLYLHDDISSRGDFLLRMAFEEYNQLEYGLYFTPCYLQPPSICKYMTLVPLLPGISFDQSLFLCHRDVLITSFENFRVERLSLSDLNKVRGFVNNQNSIHVSRNIITECESSITMNDMELKNNPEYVSFVVKVADGNNINGNNIISVINLSRKNTGVEEVLELRSKYEIDYYIDFNRHRTRGQAMITNWTIIPTFGIFSRYILREVMRMYGKSILYYESTKGVVMPPQQILDEMIPCLPRNQIEKSKSSFNININKNNEQQDDTTNIKSVHVLSKYYMSRPRNKITTRLVIIGGSTASYSILETLCFQKTLQLVNITVILDKIPEGLKLSEMRTNTMNNKSNQKMNLISLSTRDLDEYTDQDFQYLGLNHKVIFVEGNVTDIDRLNHSIILSNEVVLEYDILIISSRSEDCSIKDFPSTKGIHPNTVHNKGVFGLGNPIIDTKALSWIQSLPESSSIVVFGNSIEVVNVISSLLCYYDIEGYRLVIVLSQENFIDFLHPSIVNKVTEFIQSAGVKIYFGSKVKDVIWSSSSESQIIEAIEVSSISNESNDESKKVESNKNNNNYNTTTNTSTIIECNALLCCSNKRIDMDLHAAVNDAGIVYDGGIVVDESFRTVDPRIYAVGEISRFSRKYKDNCLHLKCNQREIGRYVANKIIQTFFDLEEGKEKERERRSNKSINIRGSHNGDDDDDDDVKIPKFMMPKSICCLIPRHFQYVESSIPTTAMIEKTDYVTESENEISLLSISYLGNITNFGYFGIDCIEEKNFSRVINFHESLLNNAIYSYEKGNVISWVRYLREDWAQILYHDRFQNLFHQLRSVLKNDKGVISIVEKVLEVADTTPDDSFVSMSRTKLFGDRCENISEITKKTIETHVIEFLREYKLALPRYYLPNIKSK